jgi:hypothetical protein
MKGQEWELFGEALPRPLCDVPPLLSRVWVQSLPLLGPGNLQ